MDYEELFKNDWESIEYSNSLELKLEIINRKIREFFKNLKLCYNRNTKELQITGYDTQPYDRVERRWKVKSEANLHYQLGIFKNCLPSLQRNMMDKPLIGQIMLLLDGIMDTEANKPRYTFYGVAVEKGKGYRARQAMEIKATSLASAQKVVARHNLILSADMYISMEVDENGFMKDPLTMYVNGKWEKFSES